MNKEIFDEFLAEKRNLEQALGTLIRDFETKSGTQGLFDGAYIHRILSQDDKGRLGPVARVKLSGSFE